MQRWIGVGRLTADPEFEHIGQNRTPKASFRVAIDRPYIDNNGERGTDFIPVTCWGKLAENVAQYLTKGRQVAVEGVIRIDTYQDNEGRTRTWTEVRANNVEFLGSSQDGNGGGNGQARGRGNYNGNGGRASGQNRQPVHYDPNAIDVPF